MKREIKIIPLVLSILGLVAVGLCVGSLFDKAPTIDIIVGVAFGFIGFTFILLMSIEFPFTKEDKKDTKIVW